MNVDENETRTVSSVELSTQAQGENNMTNSQNSETPQDLGGPRITQNPPPAPQPAPTKTPQDLGGPRILQNPLAAYTVKKGSNPTVEVTIKNPSTNASLNWNANIVYGAGATGWLNLGQIVNPIPSNSPVSLSVTVLTDNLTAGHTYTATLVATSARGNAQAPISVTVN